MNNSIVNQNQSAVLTDLIDRAAIALVTARTGGESLAARDLSRAAYDAAHSEPFVSHAPVSEVYRLQARTAIILGKANAKVYERVLRDVVYFLKAGPFIKIGKTNGDVSKRVAQLQTGCPFAIEIITVLSGGHLEERFFHRRFEHIRASGEWFHDTPELRQFIQEVTEGASA